MGRWTVGVVCAVLLAGFGLAAWSAASTKSATYDENVHLTAAWINLHQRDFRVDPENFTLWGYWAAAPLGGNALRIDFDAASWNAILDDLKLREDWARDVLYRTAGNDPDRLLRRSRGMMTLLGIGLGALIAVWAWRLRGGVAALAATILFVFDPNFLGNAPLVKNDVVFALLLLAFAFAVWRLGNRPTWPRLLAVALCCGLALNVKLSALLLFPMLALLLVLRVLHPESAKNEERPTSKLLDGWRLVAATLLAAAAVGYLTIWACYGFRYGPTPDPGQRLRSADFEHRVAFNRLWAEHPERWPGEEEIAAWQPDGFVRGVRWIERHHLLPQTWTAGTLYQYSTLQARPSFLLGEYRITGWWYYFPLAALFKTPLATLLALALAAWAWITTRRREPAGSEGRERWPSWSAICLTIPAVIYVAAALSSSLNIGVRHILPVCPFVFVGAGCGIAVLWRGGKPVFRAVIVALALWLAVASLASYPHYLAYFNAAVGGPRGALGLIGNSNLDWGQDLKLLARWRRDNPDEKLYLAWASLSDPEYYGIDSAPMNWLWLMQPRRQPQPEPGVLAISAMLLQGTYVPQLRPLLRELREQEPLEVLGGTVYIYRLPWWQPPRGGVRVGATPRDARSGSDRSR